jgi:hypothetical protein
MVPVLGWLAWAIVVFLTVSFTYGCRVYTARGEGFTCKGGRCVKSEKFGEENEAAEGLRRVVVAEDRGVEDDEVTHHVPGSASSLHTEP